MRLHLPLILSIQIILCFFGPPLAIGSKKIFLSEIWLCSWLPLALLEWAKHLVLKPSRKIPLTFLASSLVVITASYLHGSVRTELTHAYQTFYGSRAANDQFNWARELTVGIRFLSWLWAGAYVYWIVRRDEALRQKLNETNKKTLLASSALGTLILGLCYASPQFLNTIAKFYGYSDGVEYWAGRMFGTFQSPLEAAAAIVTSLGVISAQTTRLQPSSVILLCIGLLASFFTKTLSPMIGALAGNVAIFFTSKTKGSRRVWATAVFASLASLAGTYFLWTHSSFFWIKMQHFTSRADLWKIIAQATTSRWDMVLFGLGFTSLHVDNSYLFLFSRSGLLGCVLICVWSWVLLKTNWRTWTWAQKGLLFSLLATSVSLDMIIIRPVVMIMIAAGIPVLSGSNGSVAESSAGTLNHNKSNSVPTA